MYSWLKNYKIYSVYIPLVFYWILLFIATTIPASAMPEILGLSDKLKHLSAYFGLSLLLGLTLHFQQKVVFFNKHYLIITILFIAFYGAIDELHQTLVPNRSCEFLDWVADLGGGILGLSIIYIFIRKNTGT